MRKVFSEVSRFQSLIVLSLVGTTVASLCELLLPKLLSRILNAAPTEVGNGYIVGIGGLMLLVSVVSIGASILSAYNSSKLATGFAQNMREKIFRKVESFSQVEYDKFGASSLITRNTNDVLQLQNFLMMFVRVIIKSPIMAVGGLFLAFRTSPGLAVPMLVSVPVIVCFILLLSRVVIPIFTALQKKVDSVNRVMREKLSGIRVMRAFGTEDHEEKRFDAVNADLMATSLKMVRLVSFMMPGLMLIMNITTVFIIWNGGHLAATGTGVMAGDIIAVVQYGMQIMFSLVMMSMVFIMYPRAAASGKRIQEVLDTPLSITDKAETISPREALATVEFRDVTFTFPGAERPALKNISFVSGMGETTAIIGSTGSGKTALLNLIVRFYDVTEGQILVDGVDIRDMRQQELRSRIGYVPQKTMLFSGTIGDNLRYGREDAGEAEFQAAAQAAQAMPFVQEKEGVFDASVSQGATNFSGGQKQRLSIARALIREPEIYLFDDSFSALDYKTDARLRSALRGKTQNATVLLVAQRVSTILHADRIIVLDNGEMAGMGSHDELMKSCQVYREIVYSQFSDKEVAG